MRKNLETGVLHAMRAFLRVLDSGSFTAAADQMGLTVAQMSRLVGELEARLGAKLLQRTTRQRALTDIGAEYAERCREIIALVDEAEAKASGAVLKPEGRLRVQCMASFGQHYVAPILSGFCARHPGLVVDYSTSQYYPDLLARGVDVSLYLSEALVDSGLVSRKCGTTFAVLCAAPEYLARCSTPRSPDDLSSHLCLRLINPSITPEWRLISRSREAWTGSPTGPLVADTPELLLDVALQGAGITLLPLFSVIDAVRQGRLQRVLPDWRSPDISIFTLMPSRHFMDGKTRAWLEWVDSEIAPKVADEAAFFANSVPGKPA